MDVCSQSIAHWIEYCFYHFDNIIDATSVEQLHLERLITNYKREGDTAPLRIIYEANIAGFLNSLHSLLDSFPYLLNLFINKIPEAERSKIKWDKRFINMYSDMSFYIELRDFMLDQDFNKIKGYVNIIKYNRLIPIMNKKTHLEFMEFECYMPYLDNQDGILFNKNYKVDSENVVLFIQRCHDKLIPKLFDLFESIFIYKENNIFIRK